MSAIGLLKEIMKDARDDGRQVFAVGRLRFVLELASSDQPPKQLAKNLRPRIAEVLDSDAFDLEPLFEEIDPQGIVFLVLAIKGIDRTLRAEHLYAIAASLRQELDLISCEPDVGADVFVDPEEILPPGIESAVVDTYCWAGGEAPANKRWALETTGVLRAWQTSPSKGAGVIIAQPDTGITDHPEVRDANIDISKCLNILEGGTNPVDPLVADTANPGHGTGTGSVAASGEAGPIAGSAPKATLVPIRCIEDVKIFDGSPVAKAIDHAIRIGAHVVTMSLGGIWSRSMRHAIRKAVERDIIVVAAAGNCIGLVVWPAAFDDVIAVSGTNINDRKWQGSSVGSKVDFSAPAEFVWRADRKSAADAPDKVSGGQGTSFAVALTAGIAALWLSHFGRAAVMQEARRRSTTVQELFRAGARQSSRRPANWDSGLGAGVVDAAALLNLPLRQILLTAKTVEPGAAEGFESAIAGILGDGQFDSRFDWAGFGAETSSILLADAKAGRSPANGATEARAFRRASPQFRDAAAFAQDSRLAQIALRPSLAAPALVSAEIVDEARNAGIIKRIGVVAARGELTPESSAQIPVSKAQARLNKKGRKAIVDPLVQRLESTGRIHLANDVEEIEKSLSSLHKHGVKAKLSDTAVVQLEALVSLTDRPALPVSERAEGTARIQTVDAFDPSLGNFSGLVNLALLDLEAGRFASVGRIDCEGTHIGTGFVIAPGIIMTNRHVIESLAVPLPRAENPERWVISGPSTINFSPSGIEPEAQFSITDIVFAGSRPILGKPIDFTKLDIALLRVEETNAAGGPLPPAIPVSKNREALLNPVNLYVIGYPAPPSVLPRDERGLIRRDVVDRLREIFGLKYHRKYFSPGVTQSAPGTWVFDHDATTLGGNSGSLTGLLGEQLEAIGIHFAGDWLRANHAHFLAEVLSKDATLAAALP